MEFKGTNGQSNISHASQPQPHPVRPAEGNSTHMMHESSNKKPIIIVIIVAAVLLLAGLGWWGFSNMVASGVKTAQYQAVFLTNGQVYFGKLSNINSDYVILTDIYYLQVQQSVQPDDKKEENPQVSLAKLGSELHGPEDEMRINRDQVLFWENLKDTGKVVDTIKKSQSGQQ